MKERNRMVCRVCGAVAEVDRAAAEASCFEPSTSSGFVIDRAEVTFRGLCPTCQEATRSSRPVARVPRPRP